MANMCPTVKFLVSLQATELGLGVMGPPIPPPIQPTLIQEGLL